MRTVRAADGRIRSGRRGVITGLLGLPLVLGLAAGSCGGEAGAPLTYHVASDKLCNLDSVEQFDVIERKNHRTDADGYVLLICQFRTADGDGDEADRSELGNMMMSVTVYDEPGEGQSAYDFLRPDGGTGWEIDEAPGLGTEAIWFTVGDRTGLVGYDDNLYFEIEWTRNSLSRQSPPDLLARLYAIAASILTEYRAPGLPPPASVPASLVPTLPAASRPPMVYREVEDLCPLVDVSGFGQPDPAEPPRSDVDDNGSTISMSCVLRLSGPLPHQVQVLATVNMDGSSIQAIFDIRRSSVRDPVPYSHVGTAAYLDRTGIPVSAALVTYDHNLLVDVSYLITGPTGVPPDVSDRLANVARSVMAGLRNQS